MFKHNTLSQYKARTADAKTIPACEVCGRQDETLRAVTYPYVISLLFITFRRRFNGVWCKKHRNLRLFLATLITTTIGLLGVPFGLIFAPITLFKLARRGDQHHSLSLRILCDLAELKLNSGDAEGGG